MIKPKLAGGVILGIAGAWRLNQKTQPGFTHLTKLQAFLVNRLISPGVVR